MGMADRIKERRISMGFTQEELGEKLGLQKSAIAKYENGRVQNIKRSTIADMARILECSPSYLMGWDEESTQEISKFQKPDIIYDVDYHIELQKSDIEQYNALMLRLSAYRNGLSFLHDYLQLNEAGQAKLHEQLQLLSKIPEYQAETDSPPVFDMLLNAAHADADTSPEDKKHDEDIMNDDTKWGN